MTDKEILLIIFFFLDCQNITLHEHMNLSPYLNQLKIKDGKVFDPVRKRWLIVQPEELVRQSLILYLMKEIDCSINRMAVEKSIRIHDQIKRFDLVYYDKNMHPSLLAECKSPSTPITEEVLRQAVWYNYQIKAPYLLLSNGIQAQWFQVNPIEKEYRPLDSPPSL